MQTVILVSGRIRAQWLLGRTRFWEKGYSLDSWFLRRLCRKGTIGWGRTLCPQTNGGHRSPRSGNGRDDEWSSFSAVVPGRAGVCWIVKRRRSGRRDRYGPSFPRLLGSPSLPALPLYTAHSVLLRLPRGMLMLPEYSRRWCFTVRQRECPSVHFCDGGERERREVLGHFCRFCDLGSRWSQESSSPF